MSETTTWGSTTRGPHNPHDKWLTVYGTGDPEAVVWEEPGPYEGDSGFVLFLEDHDVDSHLGCLRCTVQQAPHLQTAMALALEHGVATLDPHGFWTLGVDGTPE